MTIAFATGAPYRDVDPDLPLIAAAAGDLAVAFPVWDDPSVDWSDFDVVVVRSCWDYTFRHAEFLAWTQSLPHVLNPADVMAWNTDKVYLRELADAGVPVIETFWDVTEGDALPEAEEWVVKPSISAGSRDTARWTDPSDVHRHSTELVEAGRTSMVQPYITSVDEQGETAMLYIGGTFSHAIEKGPLLGRGEGVRQDRDSREVINPRTCTAAQRELADEVVSLVPKLLGREVELAYARVDLVADDDGAPRLIEMELTEPSLFLDHSDGGAERLLEVARRAAASR